MGIKFNAYHEAGHCIMSMLFYDEIILREITINNKKSQVKDPLSSGGLDFSWKIKPKSADVDVAYKTALIALGGICSTTIYSKGIKFIEQNITRIPYDSSMIDNRGGDYDYELAKSITDPISSIFRKDRIRTQWNVFFFVFHYFLLPEIWTGIKLLAKKLSEKDDKTLSHDEIIKILTDFGLIDFLNNNRQTLLSKRFPLDRNKLQLTWPIT